jgi:hypothetical protein
VRLVLGPTPRLALRLALIACCTLFLGSVPAMGQEPDTRDVSGTWSLELSLPDGDVFAGTLSLHQEVDQITGTWQRDGEVERPRVRGEIRGKAITFFWILNIPGRGGALDGAVKMSFEGDVEGDTMSGTASFGSRAEDLNWTAERVD